ncbi:MAG: hypothetical protein KDE22_14475 [Rhodobacterales bacterium]|nr:hypothetical protein [Rhodobacterales bacterium]
MMIQGTRCLRALVWAGMAAGGLATFAGPAAAETLTLRDGRQEIVVVDMQGGEIADMRQEPSDAYKKGPYQVIGKPKDGFYQIEVGGRRVWVTTDDFRSSDEKAALECPKTVMAQHSSTKSLAGRAAGKGGNRLCQ